MKKYQHLFFDLDSTLWDYDHNLAQTMEFLFSEFQLNKYFHSPKELQRIYLSQCSDLWRQYYSRKIGRNQMLLLRFLNTLQEIKCNDNDLAQRLTAAHIENTPKQCQLIDGATEVLKELSILYQIHIITNGFTAIQTKKIENCGIKPYITKVFTSEAIRCPKPNKYFFEYALKSLHTSKENCLVIGDNFKTDIQGAQNIKIDAIWFNPEKKKIEDSTTKQISDLKELLSILQLIQ